VANDPSPNIKRPRVALRAFLAVLIAVLVVAGAVVGYLEWLLRSGQTERPDELGAAVRAQEALVDQRLEGLALAVAGVADTPELIASLAAGDSATAAGGAPAQAAPEADQGFDSGLLLDDLLDDVLDNWGLDLAVVAGPGGQVLAAAGSDRTAAEALVGSTVAIRALEEGRGRGVWRRDGRLYMAAAVRVERDFETLGLVAVASGVDRALALEARNLSRADAVFLVPASGSGVDVVATTLGREEGDALVPALRDAGALDAALGDGTASMIDLSLGSHDYEARLAPLTSPRGAVQGLSATLAERAGLSPLVRALEAVAAGAGLVALVLGALVALIAARGAWRPLDDVQAAAEQARAGDLAAASRFALPGVLAGLFTELDEKRSLEAAVAAAGREPGGDAGADSAHRQRGAVLLVEMPRYGRLRPEDEPREVTERMGRDLTRVRRAVSGKGGRVESAQGHRVMALFDGDRPEARALGAAAEVLRTLSEPENAFDEPVPPVCSIASGDTVLGGSEGARIALGLPVQQAESLLREATSGDLILAKGSFRAVDEPLRAGGVELTSQRGLLTPQPIYLLDAAGASRAATALGEMGEAGRATAGGELAALAPGSALMDRFVLTEHLATGRTSLVFLAEDRQTDTLVTVKALRRELLADLSPLEALDSGLRAALRVVHPAVARVVELGMGGGVPFVASELVEGRPLARVLAAKRFLAPAAALRVARHLAAGLGAIHEAGLAHGDVRPETLMLESRGNARLIDLGVAPLFPPPGTDPDADRALGSPRYLSPERIQGGAPSPAGDVWAAGVLLVEVFTGRPLYGSLAERADWSEVRDRVLGGPREVPDPTELPEGLAAILERCLQRDPAARYGNGNELAAALAPVRADVVR